MSGKKKEVKTIFNEIETHAFINNEMKQDWGNIKPVMAVCSGGLHPLLMPDLVKIFGNDAIFQFGGGCHGHPKGTRAGARALRQALDAVLLKIPLEKAAEERKELKQAFDKWGN
jgi:ribulose-bisphosphate carboxylase large chain